MESFNRAVNLHYRQAKFLVGLIMTRGYEGAPDDVCRVERLWRSSARQDHANAQVSYVDSALSGSLDTCEDQASDGEMADFLDGAVPQLDYVGGLLIANLRAGLDNRSEK